jgi:hypothetical protein
MMVAVYIKATCETMADQPGKGGRGLAKEEEDAADHPIRVASHTPTPEQASL